jgi:hypothetical protein
MSISGIGGDGNWWQWQASQATYGTGTNSAGTNTASTVSAGTYGTGSSGSSITNTNPPASSGVLGTFMQAFSTDLQSMLTQLGAANGAAAGTGSIDQSGTIDQTGTTQGVGHHHHHHHGGEAGPVQDLADQLVGDLGQVAQGGSLSAGAIQQSASVFASDVMQALQAFGSSGTPVATTSSVA